jgi:hypothetical protein
LDKDFSNLENIRSRIFETLLRRFENAGLLCFDQKFEPRPTVSGHALDWGGYQLSFKLIEKAKHLSKWNLEDLRRNALVIGPNQKRTFTVDFSKFEFCEGKVEADLDAYTIYVYTETMLVIEKIRAICQQMPEYPLRSNATPRARDFYDIHLLIGAAKINLGSLENREFASRIFEAKRVPLSLISGIKNYREFHRPDWPSVQNSVSETLQEFDMYFDFVVEHANYLNSDG